MNCRICAWALPALVVLGAISTTEAGSCQEENTDSAAVQDGPVNTGCPFSKKPIGPDSLTTSQGGNTIGFCSKGCVRRWQALDQPAKDAILTSFSTKAAAASPPLRDGRSIARAYIKGLETGQIESLDGLFLSDGRSSILENASNEGSWEHYRDHHLKPEMKSAANFRFTMAEETEERFGSTFLVRQVGTFSVQVGDSERAYRVAISYLIVQDADERLRIAHLHWSSRPKRK